MKGKFDEFYKKIQPYTAYINIPYQWKMRHGDFERLSLGSKDADKKYFVIYRNNTTTGIFSDYLLFMIWTDYALSHGMIPVIDRRSVPAHLYQEEDTYGIDNSWEYYYMQPMGVDLEYIADCRNVYRCDIENRFNANLINKMQAAVYADYKDDATIGHYKSVVETIRLTTEMQNMINDSVISTMGGRGRVLGVTLREGHTRAEGVHHVAAKGHPRQPSVEESVALAKEKLKEWNLEYIYVSCEMNPTIDAFVKEFGDRVLYLNRRRFDSYDEMGQASDVGIMDAYFNRDDKIRICQEYMQDIYLLSKCDSIIYTGASGSHAAFFIKDGFFEHSLYVDKGRLFC